MHSIHDWHLCKSNGKLPLVNVNYLAHFYLAAPEAPLMFGNFIGDGVRGSDLKRFDPSIARGIRFHRFIDSFTDQHPEVIAAKGLFYETQSKFSGVVVDVLFDHLLAKRWQEHHEEPLDQFAAFCYRTVDDYHEHLPVRSARFFHYMTMNDILTNYAHTSGIAKVLSGMDGRTKFTSNMAEAAYSEPAVMKALEDHFERFFPSLVEATESWKKDH